MRIKYKIFVIKCLISDNQKSLKAKKQLKIYLSCVSFRILTYE